MFEIKIEEIKKLGYVEHNTAIELISTAMNEHKMVEIEYSKVTQHGAIVYRKIEPYKLCARKRGDALYGFDPDRNTIKLFYIDYISEINILDYVFTPKWLIENELI